MPAAASGATPPVPADAPAAPVALDPAVTLSLLVAAGLPALLLVAAVIVFVPGIGAADAPACVLLVLAGLAMFSIGVLVAACAPADPVLGACAVCPQLQAATNHAAKAK